MEETKVPVPVNNNNNDNDLDNTKKLPDNTDPKNIDPKKISTVDPKTGKLNPNQKNGDEKEENKDSTQWNLADLAKALNKVSRDMLVLNIAMRGVAATSKSFGTMDLTPVQEAAKKLDEANKSLETIYKSVEAVQKTLGLVVNDNKTAFMLAVAPTIFKMRYKRMLNMFHWVYVQTLWRVNHLLQKYPMQKKTNNQLTLMCDAVGSVQTMMTNMTTAGDIKLKQVIKAQINWMVFVEMFSDFLNMLKLANELEFINKRFTKKFEYFVNLSGNIKQIIDNLLPGLIMLSIFKPLVIVGSSVLVGPKGDGDSGLIGVVGMCSKYVADNGDKFKEANKNVLYLAAAVAALTGTVIAVLGLAALVMASGELGGGLWHALGFITASVVALAGVFMLIALATRWVKEGTKTLLYIATAVAMLTATAALIILLGAYLLMPINWMAILQVGALVVILCGAFMLIALATRWVAEGSKTLLWIAAAVAIIGLTAAGLVFIAQYLDAEWESVMQVFTIIFVLSGTIVGFGLISPYLEKGYFAMIILAICMVATAGAVMMLAHVVMNTDMGKLWEGFGVMMAILGGFTAFTAALTFIPGIQLGVIMLGLLTIQIGIVAAAMKTLAECITMMNDLNYSNKEELEEKVMLPVHIFMQVVKTLAGDKEVKVRDYTKAAKKMKQMRSMATSISKIAETLAETAELRYADQFDEKTGAPTHYVELKPEHIKKAQENIVTCVLAMLDAVKVAMGEQPSMGGTIKVADLARNKKAFDEIDGKMKRKFKKLQSITESVAGMVEAIRGAASLSMVSKWNPDGTPAEYSSMKPTDFQTATDNISTIVTTFINAMSTPDLTARLDDMSKKAANNLATITSTGSGIGAIVKTVSEMSAGRIAIAYDEEGKATEFVEIANINFDSVKDNLNKTVTCFVNALGTEEIKKAAKNSEKSAKDLATVVDPISKVVQATANLAGQNINWTDLYVDGDNSKPSKVKAVVSMWTDALNAVPYNADSKVNALERSSKATINLVNAVDKADLSKLDKAYSLMRTLEGFSNSIRGNFDRLAKCINEELVDVLEELQEVLEELNNKEFNVPTPTPAGATLANVGKAEPNKQKDEKINSMENAKKLLERQKYERKLNDILNQLSACIENGSIKVITQ